MVNKVRGKFFVIGQEKWPNQQGTNIKLGAVSASDQDNKENCMFNKFTPNGTVQMFVNNPEAEAFFTLGKSIYVDFIEAPQ